MEQIIEKYNTKLNSYSVDDFKEKSKTLGISGFSKMKKNDFKDILLSIFKRFENVLKFFTIGILKSICKDLKLSGYSTMKKEDLVYLLLTYITENDLTSFVDILDCIKFEDIKDYCRNQKLDFSGMKKKEMCSMMILSENSQNIDESKNNPKILEDIPETNNETCKTPEEVVETCKTTEEVEQCKEDKDNKEVKSKRKSTKSKEEKKDSPSKSKEEKKDNQDNKQVNTDSPSKSKEEKKDSPSEFKEEKKDSPNEFKEEKKDSSSESKEEIKEEKKDSSSESKEDDIAPGVVNSVRKKKQNIPKAVKTHVWNLYIGPNINEHRCLCCKKTLIKITDFDVGHVISEKDGGTLEITNLRPICSACNHAMGTTNMIEFVKKYGYYI